MTLTDVDQIDEQELAAIVGVQSQPQQPQLTGLQSLASASKQLIALVDGPEKVQRDAHHVMQQHIVYCRRWSCDCIRLLHSIQHVPCT